MCRTLYSEHLSIVDIIFRSQLALPPKKGPLHKGHAQYQTFLPRNVYAFTLGNVLHFRLSFLRSLLFYYFSSCSVPLKCRDCKLVGNSSPYSSLWLTCFLVARMPKVRWDRQRNMDSVMEISVESHSSFTLRICTNQRNSILIHFVDWLFHALQTLANLWFSNYHISMICSNTLTLGSFFSEHRTFDTLWFQLHYTITPQSKFLKKNKPIQEEPLFS